ncbi:cytosolic sulfotransferase 1-like isoform X2 [Anguilla anguilla]|uniref:cytosolic sulfotransferase 1-like isoform X2 n=1 Tax=Anguilla anguilla TaxID=7936 RepID=UPI0015ABA630|nr:cytosolic sulfotransferase 1-like isoform X2 [Anguilla anguilla]XP_035261180.1 cytosolic sulfotransferase 1-like isoform X2 [Anguilla anguilla]XP_035261181.1 cytosolic sulfotransferase 1-like isoform X2 [Anguilla anguilla]
MTSLDQDVPLRLTRTELFDFHGVSMINYFTDNWDKVQNFQAKPDDVVIATYPKAGTTWVSHLLDLLYFGASAPERGVSVPLIERVPFLEIYMPAFRLSGVEMLDKMTTSPRLIKTHLPIQFVPKSFWEQKSRIVYVARNAKDSAVSYFHFDRMNCLQPEPGDWASYLQRFREGKVTFGSWYDHVTGWWEKSQTCPNLLYLHYEDLAEDIDRELERLCSFLDVCPTEEERRRAKEGAKFDAMKDNAMTNGTLIKAMDPKISPFMRKGKVGDWKNHFTVSQNEQFDREYREKMANTVLRFRTEI